MNIVDTAGQDEYTGFSRKAVVGVHGYIFTFSCCSRSSFEQLQLIRERLMNRVGSCAAVLVGTKSDLANSGYREVPKETALRISQEWGVPYIECSAKKNENISLVFHTLIHEIEKNSGLLDKPDMACSVM